MKFVDKTWILLGISAIFADGMAGIILYASSVLVWLVSIFLED